MREAKQRVFKNYDEIKKEVDTMVSNTLELKSFKMRDEAVNEAVNEAVSETINKTTLNFIKKLRMYGMSEEQIKEVIESSAD